MLRLSKKVDYALLALQHLASDGAPGFVSARVIAARFDIPLELLAKILQQLAHHRLIAAEKGVRGGYQLVRRPNAISIADVIQAVDGPMTFTACSPADTECEQFATCTVRDPLWRVKERLLAVLRTVTIADMDVDAPTLHSVPLTLQKSGLRSGNQMEAR